MTEQSLYEKLFSKRGLSLERLKSFCEIAQAGGMSKAAGDQVTKQSQYSRQLKELEDYFGVELFQRKGKVLVITEAGKRLQVLCGEFLANLNRLAGDFAGVNPTLTVGAGGTYLDWVLMPQLSQIRRLFPHANLQLRNMRSQQIDQALLEGEIDFGILRQDACSPTLTVRELGVMDYSLFVPKKLAQELGGRGGNKLLAALPLATLEGEGEFIRILRKAAKTEGISLRVELACSTFLMATAAVKQGSVAAILPRLAQSELPAREYERIELPLLKKLRRTMVLAYNQRVFLTRPKLAKGLDGLVKLLRTELSSHAA